MNAIKAQTEVVKTSAEDTEKLVKSWLAAYKAYWAPSSTEELAVKLTNVKFKEEVMLAKANETFKAAAEVKTQSKKVTDMATDVDGHEEGLRAMEKTTAAWAEKAAVALAKGWRVIAERMLAKINAERKPGTTPQGEYRAKRIYRMYEVEAMAQVAEFEAQTAEWAAFGGEILKAVDAAQRAQDAAKVAEKSLKLAQAASAYTPWNEIFNANEVEAKATAAGEAARRAERALSL
jgi:hypothetical protein